MRNKKSIIPDRETMRLALKCKCPKCHEGDLYPGHVSVSVYEYCSVCNLHLGANDSADGPAVFLMFILGVLVVPLALIIDHFYAPPLWAHILVLTALCLIFTLGTLRPLKSYVIALQYKYRSSDWE